jgi:DNA repair photolyase
MQTITRKSLLYKSNVEYANYCANHVLGCSHGCKFNCYALLQKQRFGAISGYNDWINPRLVSNALDLLDQEIPKLKKKIHSVHFCFTTDPFMYNQPEVTDMTLRLICRLNQDNLKSSTLTKGITPFCLADKKKYGQHNKYGITLISLDEQFRKKWEPGSAPYKDRIKALERLHEQGVGTWVSIEPYPTPNFINQDIMDILNRIKFVNDIVFGRMNYNKYAHGPMYSFYKQNARKVIDFCKKNNIVCHIKKGTPK